MLDKDLRLINGSIFNLFSINLKLFLMFKAYFGLMNIFKRKRYILCMIPWWRLHVIIWSFTLLLILFY